MQRVMLVLAVLCWIIPTASAQVEKGDSEILFFGTYMTIVGDDESDHTGMIWLNYGKFISSNLELGIGPMVLFSHNDGETDVQLASNFFANFNFTTTEKTVPYLTASWFQFDFSPEEGEDFTDYSFASIGGGVRFFFNDYAALNTSATYNFNVSNTDIGLIMVQTGVSFLF